MDANMKRLNNDRVFEWIKINNDVTCYIEWIDKSYRTENNGLLFVSFDTDDEYGIKDFEHWVVKVGDQEKEITNGWCLLENVQLHVGDHINMEPPAKAGFVRTICIINSIED